MKSEVYVEYFKAGATWFSFILMLFLFIISQVCNSGNDYWISYWTNTEFIRSKAINHNLTQYEIKNWTNKTFLFFGLDEYGLFPTHYFIYTYTLTICMVILMNYVKSMYFMKIMARANLKLHNRMFNKVLRATMHFFTVNPSG